MRNVEYLPNKCNNSNLFAQYRVKTYLSKQNEWTKVSSVAEMSLVNLFDFMMTSSKLMETFPRYWPFVRGIHRWPVNSPHKGQWHGALMFSLIYAWMNGWVNSRETDDWTRHRAHYNVTAMFEWITPSYKNFTCIVSVHRKTTWIMKLKNSRRAIRRVHWYHYLFFQVSQYGSLRPSVLIWRYIWVNIGSGNGLLPGDTKPLPERVWTCTQKCYLVFHKKCSWIWSERYGLRLIFKITVTPPRCQYVIEAVERLTPSNFMLCKTRKSKERSVFPLLNFHQPKTIHPARKLTKLQACLRVVYIRWLYWNIPD